MATYKSRARRRRNQSDHTSIFSSSATTNSPLPPDLHKEKHQQEEEVTISGAAQGKGPDLQTVFGRFWKVATPYWSSDDKFQARLRLAAVFALTLATTGISVGFNFLGRDFYNALASKDQEQFTKQLLYYLGGFAGGIPGLVTLNLLQEKKEADFRYGLVRIRENAESIAFYGGEDSEMQILLNSFRSAFENRTQLLISSRNLQFFTKGYRYLIQILPAAVVAPMYFAGKIEIGVINQSISAFNHILEDFSLIVYKFQALSAFSAVINRLGEFDDVLDRSGSSKLHSNTIEEIFVTYKCSNISSILESNGLMNLQEKIDTLLEIKNLTLKTPTGATLIRELSLTIKGKDHILIIGPSGSGKTSLLRAMAGLWKTGTGKISYCEKNGEDSQQPICSDVNAPTLNTAHGACEMDGKSVENNSKVFFLPQRPYMILGTLRQQLLYPTWADYATSGSDGAESKSMLPFFMKSPNYQNKNEELRYPTSDELTTVLEDVHLGYLLARFSLDSTHNWSSVLSLGEQQRLAFARILLLKPRLVLLDESTSALDELNEFHLYQKIGAAGITYISIGHRQTLCGYHNRILRISTTNINSKEPNWCIEPIRCLPSDSS
ncbi:ABC transporter D family member 2, chloroplastic isoform X2 [Neltuma alba]|uniref:ABC transporter D family member 2, chloroplastic isoform X2 n=1 Tax=Neltuma alba TaxID=207710 RepID=UPI0010A4A8CB|nr:ABC transporter D family member 2, chloroplastic-like isoform X2 [Prosopis alba]